MYPFGFTGKKAKVKKESQILHLVVGDKEVLYLSYIVSIYSLASCVICHIVYILYILTHIHIRRIFLN